ncbi:MAG: hypothetical protein JWO56_2651 [Acidobacteria bacterium]|nr:hypothetical protein [Acidobacteriota bacterium]
MRDPYKQAAARREIMWSIGGICLLVCIPTCAASALAAAFGFIGWWTPAAFACGIVVGRFLIAPAINHDAAGYGSKPWVKVLLRMMWFDRF